MSLSVSGPLPSPSNMPVPGKSLPQPIPGQPTQGKHAWNNIGSKAKNMFSGVKDKWSSNTQDEKRYLMAAAAVVMMVLVIFAIIAFIFGMWNAFSLIPVLMPLAFAAMWPLAMYARSKLKRSDKVNPKHIEEQKKLEKQIADVKKANRAINKLHRKKKAAAATKTSTN